MYDDRRMHHERWKKDDDERRRLHGNEWKNGQMFDDEEKHEKLINKEKQKDSNSLHLPIAPVSYD